jgi:lauroyl/myristoyl acyltransferase
VIGRPPGPRSRELPVAHSNHSSGLPFSLLLLGFGASLLIECGDSEFDDLTQSISPADSDRHGASLPRRWTLHGLNNGFIFGATRHGVRLLPRQISYAIGYAGTWLAWHSMRGTRQAIAANLAAVFPGESEQTLEARALYTLRSYARDTIDFLRALSAAPVTTEELFDFKPEYRTVFTDLGARGRGIILVTGHYGNWEVGSLLIRRMLDMRLTIVAMAEASPHVNRIRRELRDSLGADTLEVRQSLETALQIRRRLADNHIVAMLIDRHYGRDRVGVRLFGRRAWFLRTPLLMAHATGAPILPCFVERLSPGRFAPVPDAPIFVAADRPRDEAIQAAAQQVADALATRIRQRPELWYHFYRYWDAQSDAYDGLTGW